MCAPYTGWTALLHAAITAIPKQCNCYLMLCGRELWKRNRLYGLVFGCDSGHVDAVRLLLDAGARSAPVVADYILELSFVKS